MRVAFLPVGETRLELLEPTQDDSPIAKFLESRGEGIHHIALKVTNIEESLAKSFALEDNVDFRLIQTQEELAEMNLKNERAQYWPSVGAFYSLAWQAQRNSFNFFDFNNRWYRLHKPKNSGSTWNNPQSRNCRR